MKREAGRCARCQRLIRLTVQGKLFLHTDRPAVWVAGQDAPDLLGDHCPGGMTRDYTLPGELAPAGRIA